METPNRNSQIEGPERAETPPRGGIREVLHIAYPLILTTASISIMHFFDRVFLSWYDPLTIAASTPAGIASFTIICPFMGIAAYTNTLVAQHFGAGEKDRCTRSTWQGIFFSLFAYGVILLFIPLGPSIFRLGGHAPEVIGLELKYYTVLMWGGGLIPLNSAISAFFSGLGDTRATMWANVAGTVVNLFLDYALIFGKWGFPEMGITGAAIATVLSSTIPVVILFVRFLFGGKYADYRSRASFGFDRPLMSKLLRYGTPSGIQFFLDIFGFTLFVFLVGRLGESELAVTNIVMGICHLSFMPMIGLSMATSILVGQYMGRGHPEFAERSTYTALKIALIYMGSMAIIFMTFPGPLLGIFRPREGASEVFAQMLALGKPLMIMLAFFAFFDAFGIIFSGALKGAGDTRFPMWASVILSWTIFVPPVYLTVEVYQAGVHLAWLWAILYLSMLAIILFRRFRRGKWKSIDMVGRDPAPPPLTPIMDEIAK